MMSMLDRCDTTVAPQQRLRCLVACVTCLLLCGVIDLERLEDVRCLSSRSSFLRDNCQACAYLSHLDVCSTPVSAHDVCLRDHKRPINGVCAHDNRPCLPCRERVPFLEGVEQVHSSTSPVAHIRRHSAPHNGPQEQCRDGPGTMSCRTSLDGSGAGLGSGLLLLRPMTSGSSSCSSRSCTVPVLRCVARCASECLRPGCYCCGLAQPPR